MRDSEVIRVRIGKRWAYIHPPMNGYMSVFMPDQHYKEDLHSEVAMTTGAALRLARALLKQART